MPEPYSGADMISYLLEQGFILPGRAGRIRSMVNIRDTAVIVTDLAVFVAKPGYVTGFSVFRLAVF